ncbi:hypothetical protein L208DRAFT_1235773 [Tricholoma matsutake]|nr:hypothetical protein L208DRAFT_1235773 [Tricholoma matsutake 945]
MGAKLSKLTQSLAYKGIQQWKLQAHSHQRRARTQMINKIQNEVEDTTGKMSSKDQIWKAIHHKDFSRNAQYFLWMTAHDADRVGKYWLKEIFQEEIQNRCECPHCEVPKTMDHILTQCETPGQKVIWELAEQMWTQKDLEWHQPWLGNIVSCALTEFKKNNGIHTPGANRFRRILVSESAHLIWKLLCKRVIKHENTPYTPEEISNRWYKMMNVRLKTDCSLTSPRYGKKGLKPKIVVQTWKSTLENEEDFPRNWTVIYPPPPILIGVQLF